MHTTSAATGFSPPTSTVSMNTDQPSTSSMDVTESQGVIVNAAPFVLTEVGERDRHVRSRSETPRADRAHSSNNALLPPLGYPN